MTDLLTETDKIPMERITDLLDSLQNLNTILEEQVLLLNGKINQNTQAITANTQLINTLDKPGDICYSLRSEKEGWLLCNGQAVSRTIYQELFATIGTTYGQGDGSTTFNVPDYRGKFLQMVSSSQEVGEELEAGLPNITGSMTNHGSTNDNDSFGSHFSSSPTSPFYFSNETTYCFSHASGRYSGNYSTINFNASRSNSIYGNSSTVQPPAYTVNYFIKF